MIKALFGIIVFLLLLVLIPLTALGLVPGLSSLVGAGPRDLGIKINVEDSVRARTKVGTEIISLPKNTDPKDDFVLEGKRDADLTMDSHELTAHSNNRPWKNYPVKNLQIKIS